jgi:uracil-DNA glycosylase
MKLDPEWKELLRDYLAAPQARDLAAGIAREYAEHKVCPPYDKVFNAFNTCLPKQVKVVILGQDPYFNAGQATGMAFSIDPNARGIQFPPTLGNIIREVRGEFGACAVEDGDLSKWARQGVLLLNTCLTVRQGSPLSHADIGWEHFTRAVIACLDKCAPPFVPPIVFVLWGTHAKKYRELLTNPQNLVLTSAHPSPLSAHNGFFGCGHFKKINEFLLGIGKTAIEW